MRGRFDERGFAEILVVALVAILLVLAANAASSHSRKVAKLMKVVETPTPVVKVSASVSPTPTVASGVMTVFGETVPSDFGTYIQAVYAASKCPTGASFTIDRPVVRDQFAAVDESCQAGAEAFYIRLDGQWTYVFGSQNLPDCSEIDKYAFTKQLVPQCFSLSGAVEANINP